MSGMYNTRSSAVSVRSHPLPSHPPPFLGKTSSGGPSPRAATPTRIHNPRSTRTQGHQHMAAPSDPDAARSPTPRRNKRNTGRRRADKRSHLAPSSGPENTEPDVSTDEDLFELLGVTDAKSVPQQHQKPGLIQLSKESMEAATKKTGRKANIRRADDETPASSEPDAHEQPQQHPRTRRGKKHSAAAHKVIEDSSAVDTDLSATPSKRRTRSAKGQQTRAEAVTSPADASYDMSSLSRSLPASFFAEAQKDEQKKGGKKWDMPHESPTGGNEALTWQQQLQNETTPSKNTRNNGRRGSKAPNGNNKAGGLGRRSSLDQVPASGITAALKAAVPASTSPPKAPNAAIPVSAFDSSIPFHTGFNVHRAPQTPIRSGGAKRSTAVTAHDGVITLPIVGDFPRINRANPHAAPIGAVKYAGPTFHNSPASGSLPKPDLDDF